MPSESNYEGDGAWRRRAFWSGPPLPRRDGGIIFPEIGGGGICTLRYASNPYADAASFVYCILYNGRICVPCRPPPPASLCVNEGRKEGDSGVVRGNSDGPVESYLCSERNNGAALSPVGIRLGRTGRGVGGTAIVFDSSVLLCSVTRLCVKNSASTSRAHTTGVSWGAWMSFCCPLSGNSIEIGGCDS